MRAMLCLCLFFAGAAWAGELRLSSPERVKGETDFPVGICQRDKETILFTEKSGNVMVIRNGEIQKEPLKTFDVATGFERGLLGIACGTQGIFVYHSYTRGLRTFNRVVRVDTGKTVLDGIPGSVIHNGGAVALGPDGMLYVSTGDAREKESAQDVRSLSGKVLRIKPDGAVPADNPFRKSPVWTLGHRNVFGMAFNGRGELFITENGTDRDDEVNRAVRGGNYGWPVVLGTVADARFINPIKTFTPNIAPTNAAFFRDWFIFGTWNTGEILGLRMVEGKVVEEKTLHRHGTGITDVEILADGLFYFTAPDGIWRTALEERQ